MKDPWRDPKGDPFGEEGSGALDDFLTPFARCDARGDCRDSHSSVTDRAPGSWHLHNSAMWQRETEARSRFLMTGLRGVQQLRDRWRGQKKNRGKEMLFGVVGTTQELVFLTDYQTRKWECTVIGFEISDSFTTVPTLGITSNSGNAQCWYSCGSPFSRQGNQPWPWTWIFFGVVPRSVVWQSFLDYSDL